MPADSVTAFDVVAADYDLSFSQALIGQAQRAQSRKWLSAFLTGKKSLHILEINCGTGDDALWMASLGHTVVATDVSSTMIEQAKKKIAFNNPDLSFHHCAFDELPAKLGEKKFDLIFSNFSGLNCAPADELAQLNDSFHQLLNNDGHIAVVIFGKYCCWETLYFLLKLSPVKAFRRWKKAKAVTELKENIFQPVYYYSTSRFCHKLNRFRLVEKRPVGLFLPPSYLEQAMRKRIGFYNFLNKLEKKWGGMPAFSQLADHSYLLLKKQ